MEDDQAPVPTSPHAVRRGTRASSSAPSRRCGQATSGRSRTKLQMEGRKRDLALFNLAIDSKLRGCDVVAVRVDDVAPSGYAMDRATIRQKKTGQAGSVRADRPDTNGDRRVPETDGTKARPVPIRWSRDAGLTTGSMPGSCRSGWPALGSIRPSSARTRCAARRRC